MTEIAIGIDKVSATGKTTWKYNQTIYGAFNIRCSGPHVTYICMSAKNTAKRSTECDFGIRGVSDDARFGL